MLKGRLLFFCDNWTTLPSGVPTLYFPAMGPSLAFDSGGGPIFGAPAGPLLK